MWRRSLNRGAGSQINAKTGGFVFVSISDSPKVAGYGLCPDFADGIADAVRLHPFLPHRFEIPGCLVFHRFDATGTFRIWPLKTSSDDTIRRLARQTFKKVLLFLAPLSFAQIKAFVCRDWMQPGYRAGC